VIPIRIWRQVAASTFEALALAHVRDVYPNYRWCSTRASHDGGKDGLGVPSDLTAEIREIYWMEAKHHPASRSLGQYTLDTHLMSAFFSQEVKRLHVVTSASVSAGFLIRANAFAGEHGFAFAHSDRETVEAWLAARTDVIQRYFPESASEVVSVLESQRAEHSEFFAHAALVPDQDSLAGAPIAVPHLLPGRKFRLVITVSVAAKIGPAQLPLRVKWSIPPDRISILRTAAPDAETVLHIDPSIAPIATLPFRLLRFGPELPSPTIETADGRFKSSLKLIGANPIRRLASPFVGQTAREYLLRLRRVLADHVATNVPHLIVCRGRAGAGKTRLAEELRDDAETLGYRVGLLEMTSSPRAQEDRWKLLFRSFFGLEHNPFGLAETEVLGYHTLKVGIDGPDGQSILRALKRFLIDGIYSEEIFNLDLPNGKRMAQVVRSLLYNLPQLPYFLHIDDAHHLSRPQLRPLYFLRHIIESSDNLPLCLLVTGRNDETVRDSSFSHFVSGLDLSGFRGCSLIDLPDMSQEDARELVVSTLRWPELLAAESKTLALIIEHAGTNPFTLMQTLDHLAIDCGTVAFGEGEHYFLIDVPAFKNALAVLPSGIRAILSERFSGLVRQSGRKLLLALSAIAAIGRRAPRHLVNRALSEPLSRANINRLFALGYLANESSRDLELAHDLLVEALRQRPELRQVAAKIAQRISQQQRRPLTTDQTASIYFAAGPRFYERSYKLTRAIIESHFRSQEYLSMPPLLHRMESIASQSGTALDAGLNWISAVAEQHCGNTHRALKRFERLRHEAERTLPDSSELYIDSTIEIANQHYLRAEVSPGVQLIEDALAYLKECHSPLTPQARARLFALAHNRLGALLHLAEQRREARTQMESALILAGEAEDFYLISHTHRNLGTLLRFAEPSVALKHLLEARRYWVEQCQNKERLRIMLDCSEAYSACLESNNLFQRAKLRAVAAEASEKGYFAQACGTLLCLAACDLEAARWREARHALLRGLDLTTVAEDLKSRAYIAYYLSVSADALGQAAESRDWSREALRLLADPALRGGELSQCLNDNLEVLSGVRAAHLVNEVPVVGRLRWYRYDRS